MKRKKAIADLQRIFKACIEDLLNDLEWFSMNFRYNLADEEIVYQSLHQTFLSAIWLLYVYISQNNNQPGGGKFYTNVIWLFNLWKNRLRKIEEKAKKNEKKHEKKLKRLESKGKAINRKYTKEQEQSSVEKYPVHVGKRL